MLSARDRQAGASLVEVMIGITLVGILIAMGLPSMKSGLQNRQIRAAADAIQNGLQVARTEAVRRNRTVKFELRDENGWRIGCDPVDETVVDGQPTCPETLQTREGSEGSRNATVDRVTVSASAGTDSGTFTDLKFSSLGRVTTDSLPASNNAVFRVTLPKGGACAADAGEMRCLSVIVTPAGQIRMCDPDTHLQSNDPRRC